MMGLPYNYNIYGRLGSLFYWIGLVMKVVQFETREELISVAVILIKEELQKKSNKLHAVMLSGGSTPLGIYKKIAENPFFVDPHAVITYSDERLVPINDNENNYYQSEKMVKALKIKAENIIRVKTELGHDESAEAFHKDLSNLLLEGRVPLGVLGMGADGHTASLFTLKNVDEGQGKMAIAVTKDKPPHRVSVTKEFLDQCDKLIVLLAGVEKQEILKVLLKSPESIPAGKALKNHPCVEVWVSV